MKKIIALVAAAVLSASAVFAGENFKNTLGAGLTIPVTKLSFEEDRDDISQTGVGFDLTWLGVNTKNGLSFKVDFGLDFLSSDEFDNADLALELSLDLGAGYSFVRTDKFSLAAFGMIGFTYGGYEWTYNSSYIEQTVEVTADINYLTFDLGADLVGKYQFTEHFGAFASLGFRYMIGLSSEFFEDGKLNGEKVIDFDTDLTVSGFKFVPTIGLSWTF